MGAYRPVGDCTQVNQTCNAILAKIIDIMLSTSRCKVD